MSCENISGCGDVLSSSCVTWQGDDVPCLGIVAGQTLTVVETAIASRVCELTELLNLTEVELCDDFIKNMAGVDKTLANLLQALFDDNCDLRDLITQVQDQTEVDPIVVDFKCIDTTLDPCDDVSDLSLSNILQLIINAHCALKTQVDDVVSNINNTVTTAVYTGVKGALNTCADQRIVPNDTDQTIRFRGFVPPMTALPYFGSLSHFDNTGKGLGPMCDWAICNGENGTVDMRGVVPVGAIQGVGGNTLPTNVDPSLPANSTSPSANYSVGDRGGKITHKLSGQEIPSHSHQVTDPGHNHRLETKEFRSDETESGTEGWGMQDKDNGDGPSQYTWTDNKNTGITIQNTGGDQPHENRMPYVVCAWIMMVN